MKISLDEKYYFKRLCDLCIYGPEYCSECKKKLTEVAKNDRNTEK